MGDYTRVEISVGLFVMMGLAAVAYLSISIGGGTLWPTDRYSVSARFASVGDLSEGAVVKLAGVPVGEVNSIGIDQYAALVGLRLDRSIELPTDTIASIKTAGLLGEAYVALSPGADEANLAEGGRIAQTEPPLDLFELIEKYAFDDDGERGGQDDGAGSGPADAGSGSPFPDPLE